MPRCPRCSTHLTRVEDAGIKLHTCSACLGAWIEHVAMLRLLRMDPLPEAIANTPLDELAALVTESDTRKALKCTECFAALNRERVQPLIPVYVDRCKKCAAVWFDVGELPLARRLAYELAHSEDPTIIALKQKVANINFELAERKGRIRDLTDNMNAPHMPGSDGLDYTRLDSLIRMLSGR